VRERARDRERRWTCRRCERTRLGFSRGSRFTLQYSCNVVLSLSLALARSLARSRAFWSVSPSLSFDRLSPRTHSLLQPRQSLLLAVLVVVVLLLLLLLLPRYLVFSASPILGVDVSNVDLSVSYGRHLVRVLECVFRNAHVAAGASAACVPACVRACVRARAGGFAWDPPTDTR
jgi:hypothetical protein